MPSTRTMYPNDRNMAFPDIGSDGNRSAQSLTSNDFISESFRETHSHSQIRDVQIRENVMDTENVCEIAMKTPHMVEWKLPKEVELRSTGKEPFGLNFKLRVIAQTKDGPKDLFLLVDSVKSQSPASKILNRGDLILSVNRIPTHCSQDEVNSEEFVASVKNLTKKAERLHLRIQSPRRRRQTISSVKLNSFSRQGGHSMFAHEESVQPSLLTRPSVQVTDMLSCLRLAESTCQASVLPKVPYSKIIVLGENNALLAKVLLGSGSNKMTRIESFSKGSFILKNSKESSWERSFQVKSTVSTFKTWLRDAKNLKECLDRNVRRLIETQFAPPESRYGCREFCGDNNSIYIDLFAPVQTNKHISNLTASLLMTGNEVYVYDLPAARLFQETKLCLTEAQALLSRIRSLAGRRVPVVLVVTHTGKLDAQDCAAIGDALERFFANSLTAQLVYFDNTTPCCFVNLDELVADDGSLSSNTTIGRECSHSEEITNFNTPLANLKFKVMQLLWEQNYLAKYSVQFLRYNELFWRMIDQAPDQKYYFRREIKEACCIRKDTELSDFITYLKLLGELSGETSDAHDLQQTFLRPSSLHLPLTKMLTGISEERQHPHLREEWNILETTGIASSVLLRTIFDDFEERSTISYLQMLGIMYPLSSFAAQSFVTPLPRNREDNYNLVTSVSTSVAQCKCFLHDKHSLRIKFSGWIPTGFLVKLVLKMIDNMNFPSARWRVCQSGCYEINTGKGCRLLFQEDLLSASIKVSTSFQERHLPNYILQLLIKISKELSTCEDERPLVGCDCPLDHSKDKDEMHVLDLDVEHNRDIICGNQRLNEHSHLLFWLMTMNLKEVQPSTMPNVPFQYAGYVSREAAPPDSLNNLNPEVYTWLCDKLNVADTTSQRDWRLVAAKLGFKKEDIDFFDHHRPDWNPCHRVFERWMQTGMATVSRLRQILEGIGRKDIVCELDRRCGYFPTTTTE